ncbi:hypothetical protein FRC09_009419 [Ceratobasidium sp. 395]|nr:hypothetical protein FRC09_009419 [Ceratobasidium sp. 395]
MGLMRKLIGSLATGILLGASVIRADDLQTMYERRLPLIVADTNSTADSVKDYLKTIREDGTWAALNYTTGCDAWPSSWPAGDHWIRILALTAAYHGGVPGADQYTGSTELRTAIGKAMDWWFANDFSTIGNGACLDAGGKADDKCPCGTPGLWNTNWFR